MKFVSSQNIDKILAFLSNKDFDVNKEILFENMKNVELDGDKIRYDYIYQYIKNIKESDTRYYIENNAKLCIGLNKEDDENVLLMKILSHIVLEAPRAAEFETLNMQNKKTEGFFRDIKQVQRDFQKQIKSFDKDFNEFNNRLDELSELENKFSNIKSEFIGILSIFAAVIIGFFGGLNYISNILSNIDKMNEYRMTVSIILIGLVMFNVIYMLLNYVSILSGKEINRDLKKCNGCKSKNRLRCVINKYPYAFYYNIFSIIILLYTYMLSLMDKYNIISANLKGIQLWFNRILFWTNERPYWENKIEYIPLAGMILIIFISIVPIYILSLVIRLNRCNDITEDIFEVKVLKKIFKNKKTNHYLEPAITEENEGI